MWVVAEYGEEGASRVIGSGRRWDYYSVTAHSVVEDEEEGR